MDEVMKQTDADKKYALLQSRIATSFKKRKQIEEAVNSSQINPPRKRMKVITYDIDTAVFKWLQEKKSSECSSKLSFVVWTS